MFDKLGLVITGLALVLNIIGVIIPYWFFSSLSINRISGSANFGLWSVCAHVAKDGGVVTSKCLTFDGRSLLPATFLAAQTLEILTILATAAAIFVVCLKVFYMKENSRLLYIATPIPVFAGLLMMIGALVFVINNDAKKETEADFPQLHLKFKPHAAFFLCMVSGTLNLVASPILFLAARAISGLPPRVNE